MKSASWMILAAVTLCGVSVLSGEPEMTAREKALKAAGLSPSAPKAPAAKAPPRERRRRAT